jgi:antitoxin component of MazEF toxin-antitoxin module
MTTVIRDSNMLPIPENLALELGLQSGSSVEVTRTANGFEVRPIAIGLRRSSTGTWHTHAERVAILDRLEAHGKQSGITSGLEDFLRMRDEEDAS